MRMQTRIISVIALLCAGAGPALADRIDGDWCTANGKHLKIDGPRIQIPSGLVIEGNYDRHNFDYVGPAGDPEEGQAIHMSQQSEESMLLWRKTGDVQGPAEEWRRCSVTS